MENVTIHHEQLKMCTEDAITIQEIAEHFNLHADDVRKMYEQANISYYDNGKYVSLSEG